MKLSARACWAMVLALAGVATQAQAQSPPAPLRGPRGAPRSPAVVPSDPQLATAVETAASFRAHFGVEMAMRLLRSGDPEERLRGLERVAVTRTPDALSLLERVSGAGLPGATVEGVARQDPRALLVVVRGLASRIDEDRARAALENLLKASSQMLALRGTPGASRQASGDETDNAGRILLAREEAAMALAQSGSSPALDSLISTARSGGPGQVAALEALRVHPPSSPLLGGVNLTTPAMVAVAAEVGDLRALDAIKGAAQSSDPGLRAAAIAAMGVLGDARVLGMAREAATHKDARVRVAGADALAHLGAPEGARAVEALVADDVTARDGLRIAQMVSSEGVSRAAAARAVVSSDAELRSLAVAALGRQTNQAAVTALVTLASDARLAGDTMDALARSPSPGAMAGIETLATKPAMRRLAARAYFVRRTVRGERSPQGDALLATLAAAGDGADRALGVLALVSLGERPLDVALVDRDPRVRRAAAMAWMARRDATDAPEMANILARRLTAEPDEITRKVLAVGLVEGDPQGLIPTTLLLDLAQRGGPEAPLAALALARRADEELTPKVEALLASSDPVMRAHTARGLGASTLRDAVGRLAQAYQWEPVADVRRALIDALVRSKAEPDAPSRRRALELAARLDPDGITREMASRALDGRRPLGRQSGREVAWMRLIPADGAVLPRELTATVVSADGVAIPVVFDEEGFALVPGLPPGSVLLRMESRVPGPAVR